MVNFVQVSLKKLVEFNMVDLKSLSEKVNKLEVENKELREDLEAIHVLVKTQTKLLTEISDTVFGHAETLKAQESFNKTVFDKIQELFVSNNSDFTDDDFEEDHQYDF